MYIIIILGLTVTCRGIVEQYTLRLSTATHVRNIAIVQVLHRMSSCRYETHAAKSFYTGPCFIVIWRSLLINTEEF